MYINVRSENNISDLGTRSNAAVADILVDTEW